VLRARRSLRTRSPRAVCSSFGVLNVISCI
jgi:hypothetical protein